MMTFRVGFLFLQTAVLLSLAACGCVGLPERGICAHRGDREACPENTLPAFRSAVAKGAAMVEFDVARCATGELVVMHDQTIDRTTTGTGEVAKLSFAYLRSVDAGVRFSPAFVGTKIPTFDEAVDVFPRDGLWLNVHCKGDGVAAEVARRLEEKGRLRQAVVRDFLPGVRAARAAVPNVKVCLVAEPANSWEHDWTAAERREVVEVIVAERADFVQPHFAAYTAEELKPFHDIGGKVNYFWCNDPERLKGLLDGGIDFPLTDTLTPMLDKFNELTGRGR